MAKLVTLVIPSASETKYFKDILEMRGFRVSTHSGIALQGKIGGDERPDLIVVDLQRDLETGLLLPATIAGQAGHKGIPIFGLVPSREVLRQAAANGYASGLLMPTTIPEMCAAFRPFIGDGRFVGAEAGGRTYQGISVPS
jgi:CheY-like chemotaxis protein